MGCFGSKEESSQYRGGPGGTIDAPEPPQSGAARNDGGLIGRHGHVGAVMVGLGAGNYGGGFGGPEVGGGWGPSGWGADSRVVVKKEAAGGGGG